MNLLRRNEKPESKTYTKAKRRLETVPSEEVLRYVDNTHSAIGQTVADLRKSLHNRKAEEALPLLLELEQGAETIRAAVAVLSDRQ